MLRLKNELYYWLWFKWVRLIKPYSEPSRNLFQRYHPWSWEFNRSDMTQEKYESELFNYDEIFVSPCIFNTINCGGIASGSFLSRIGILSTRQCKDG